jgi:capsular polysaccharide transport system permease protein
MTFRVTANAQSDGPLAATVKQVATRLRSIPPLFVWVVVVPGIVAAIYFFIVASPIYISQAQFIVRAANSTPQPNGIAAVLLGGGLSPAESDSYIVHDYAMSHDAIAQLEARHHLRDALGPPGADFLSRFPHPFEGSSFEKLAEAYPRFVSVDYNSSTGISTLQVRSFRPQDAQEIASAVLEGSEALINRLNDRANVDAITETRQEIATSENDLARTEENLTAFRNREKLIDPTRSSAVNLDLLGKLQGEIATLQAERAGLAANAPQSPQLPALDSRIKAYEQQARDQQTKMAGETDSLAPMIGEYERLTLDRDFAGKTVEAAAGAAETARLEAKRKRLYLERISNPSLPDSATEPHRVSNFLTVIFSLFLAYGTISLVIAGFREHQQR